jgi:hypothetical protein
MYPSKCPKCGKYMNFYMTEGPQCIPHPHFKCICGYDTSKLYNYTTNKNTLNNTYYLDYKTKEAL